MNKYKTVLKHTLYVTVGTVGSKLLYVLMLPLYTRWLTTSEFGAADTVTTIADILVILVFLNIGESIFVCPKNASEENQKKYFTSGFLFILVMMAVAALVFCCIGVFFQENSIFVKYKYPLYFLLVARYIQVFVQSFTRSLNKMIIYSTTGIILTFLIAILSIILVPKYGVYGYLISIAFAHLLTAVYTSLAAKLYLYFELSKYDSQSLKEMLRYSIPLAPNSIMWWLINGINRPIMSSILGYGAIGVYAVSSRISGVINSLSEVLGTAWGNSVLDEYNKNGFEEFYNNYMRFLITVYFLGGLFMILISEPLVHIFSTQEYYAAYKYIPLLVLGLIFSGISSCVGQIFAAIKKSKYFLYSSIFGGIVSIVFLLLLIKPFGLFGVAISLCISFCAIFIARWYYASKYIHLDNIKYVIELVALYIISYVLFSTMNGMCRYLFAFISILIIGVQSRKAIQHAFSFVKNRIKNK